MVTQEGYLKIIFSASSSTAPSSVACTSSKLSAAWQFEATLSPVGGPSFCLLSNGLKKTFRHSPTDIWVQRRLSLLVEALTVACSLELVQEQECGDKI